MMTKGKLLKIYCDETEKWKGRSLYRQLVTKLKTKNVARVTVHRAILGCGRGKSLQSIKILDLSGNLPIVVEAFDTEENIIKIYPELQEIVPEGQITIMDIDIMDYS